MSEYWIFKGTSNFCDELAFDYDDLENTKGLKHTGDFYDLVSTKDTIEGGIHVVEMAKVQKLIEALEFYADNNSYVSKHGGHIQNKNLKSFIGRDCGSMASRALKDFGAT